MDVRKVWLFRAILLTASLLIGGVILEVGLRLSNAYAGQAYSVSPTGSQFKFFMFDSELGWKNAPGMNGVFDRDEFTFPIRINEDGMRGAPVTRERGERARIAVLGDSFTWGVGVPDEARFTERLAEMTGAEVLNFGVSGYSPVQYHLLIEHVLSFSPDLVLIAFCLANDFGDNVFFQRYGYYKPYAALDEQGQLALRGYPLPNVDDFGFREQAEGLVLTQVIQSALSTTFFLPDQEGLDGFSDWLLYTHNRLEKDDQALTDEAIAINDALLGEIADAVREAGRKPVLVPVPTKCEYSITCKNDNSQRRDHVHRILQSSAERLGIEFIPTMDVLDSDHFWVRDTHWKPSGHERIAQRIAEHLETAGLLD